MKGSLKPLAGILLVALAIGGGIFIFLHLGIGDFIGRIDNLFVHLVFDNHDPMLPQALVENFQELTAKHMAGGFLWIDQHEDSSVRTYMLVKFR